MKKLILIALSFVLIENSFAGIPENATEEAWLALTCRGCVTPPAVYPPIFKDVMKFHVKVDPSKPYPSLKELSRQTQYMPQFQKMTKLCTDKRTEMEKAYTTPSAWLDWNGDFGYSRLVEGEVFIPMNNGCRTVGQPCERISQCCGYANPLATRNTCDLNTNTCSSLVSDRNATDPLISHENR